MKNFLERERERERGPLEEEEEKEKTESATGVGRRTRGDRKVESNDSREIPDRRETSDIPGLPSGGKRERERN